jgi:tetratricopeptide (TPR) repeat protein
MDTGEIRPPDPLMDQLDGLLQSAVAYETRGTKALAERNWLAAADNFRKGLELAPNEFKLRHKLGTALFMMGETRGALEQFETVVRRSPSFAKGHYSLGVLMAARGQFQGAIEELSAATQYDPNYVEAHLGFADALRRSGRVQDSIPGLSRRRSGTRWRSFASGATQKRETGWLKR